MSYKKGYIISETEMEKVIQIEGWYEENYKKLK